MKREKLYKLYSVLKYDAWVASLLLAYPAIAAVIVFSLYGKTPIQMYNPEVFVYLFLIPASLIASLYALLLGYLRKEPISAPIFRWITSTLLALCLVLFWPSFSALKVAIPKVSPFYFDQYLIEIDRWLHFGIDPWKIVHYTGIFSESAIFDFVYFKLWLLATTIILLFFVYFDENAERRTRYIFLYVLTWVFLGNVLAAVFASAGPIYVERLTGDPAFRDLESALVAAGYEDSLFFEIQNQLWANFTAGKQQLGTGISAFPSVHVGIACVIALYMSERSRWLIAPGWCFVVLILAGSVYSGWHYAADGYASIAIVLAMHRALRKRFAKLSRTESASPQGYAEAGRDVSVA